MTACPRVLAPALLLVLHLAAVAQNAASDARFFEQRARPFLARHCIRCHGAVEPKAGLRLDRLTADFTDGANRERWLTALRRARAGEMPPQGQPAPPAAETRAVAAWVQGRADAALAARRAAGGRVPLRRLNRVEYENTVRDLLGVDVELKEMLPPDSAANGFDTNSEAQHVSSFLLERYLDAAERALNIAIASGPRPAPVRRRLSCKDERQVRNTTESVFRVRGDEVVCFSSSPWQAIHLWQFYPQDRGRYRFRISASAVQSGGKPVAFRVDAGPMLMGTQSRHVGYFDAPPEQPAVIEFTEHLEARSTLRILPYGLASAQAVHRIGAERYDGPGLAIQWIEVEGPLHDAWPPESHRRLFGELPQAPAPNSRTRLEVRSPEAEADAERIVRAFAGRAFRRPPADEELRPILELVRNRLAGGYTFEQAARVGLSAALVSPGFLYLREAAGPLDDFALAARLSYFLWSSMPDQELLSLAGEKRLGRPEVLRAQVERLLAHPKAAAFAENFTGQWLGLRDIDFTEPSHILYPEYDHLLRVSMLRETELFFSQLLKEDLGVGNFLASDFSMLNGRLARHYGIPGVEGYAFRKVALPPGSRRGGVLTMASVLKVTANGTTTSPVARGAWVLDRILGTPAPPPPADVPAVEPDIRGAVTIRQQLAKHRELPACAGCHAKIDPPGFALESFDVIGGWREHYRTTGRGEAVMVDGRRMPYLKGPKVEPGDTLADGRRFRDVDELKQLLLADRERFARALAVKLLTYATGAPPEAGDGAEVEAILARARPGGHGFRTLIHAIVQSRLFRQK